MVREGYNVSSIRSVMKICGTLCRRKKVDDSNCQSSLARVLTVFDLTALGIGSTLGVGIYVLAGDVSKSVAGPAVIISFLLAAIASLFAGLCYAEFGARVPKAGSAYVYSYYCVGELMAFIIGWCLILEYVIGAASVARGISTYIDCLLCGKIKGIFMAFAPIDATFLSPYVDFFSFTLCIILACALASGVRESTIINNFLTFCNMSLVLFIIISGLFKVDIENWRLEKYELPGPEAGEGGFAPFGIIGIIKGAAICFYGFIGFDSIATTGEEVKNPHKAIPIAIITSLIITFLAYFGVSSVLTLMWPYYLQDPDAPLPHVYSEIGWDAAKWLVSIGALFGLFSSFYGAMFPLPRIMYAMASDGLIFRVLADVSPRTKTPVVGTLTAGLVTATMSALFNLQQLISLMAMGTLLAYTIVAVCVLILRYSPDCEDGEVGEATSLVSNEESDVQKGFFRNYFSCGVQAPTACSKAIATLNIILYCISAFIVSLLLTCYKGEWFGWKIVALIFACVFGTLMLIIFLSLCSQPKADKCMPFKVPLVPLLPCISIFLNIYLMVSLDHSTWIKLAVWMAVGFIPYLCWYFWKYLHGELGENSRYNINRVNHVKFNELVWKLMNEKKKRLKGQLNEAFVSDLEPSKTIQQMSSIETKPEEEIPNSKEKNWIYDEIFIYNEIEKKIEIVEINNNICKFEEPDDKNWSTIAEIHAVDIPAVEEVKADEGLSNDDSKVDEEIDKMNEGIDVIIQRNKPIIEELKEKVFGSEIPIGRRIQQPRIKLKIDKKHRLIMSDFRENEIAQSKLKIRGKDGLITNEMREKLNKILADQTMFIQSGLTRPSIEVNQNTQDSAETYSSNVDIKTLTKTEIKNKLQKLLREGPPKKPSFRRATIPEKSSEKEPEVDKG